MPTTVHFSSAGTDQFSSVADSLIARRVFAGLWVLLGVWQLFLDHVWAGIGWILFGVATGLYYEIKRKRAKRTK